MLTTKTERNNRSKKTPLRLLVGDGRDNTSKSRDQLAFERTLRYGELGFFLKNRALFRFLL